MKRKFKILLLIESIVLIIVIGSIYLNDLKQINDDLVDARQVVFQTYTFFERNNDNLKIEEFQMNLLYNNLILKNYMKSYSSKPYLPKHKVKLMNELFILTDSMYIKANSFDKLNISSETLEAVYKEMGNMLEGNGDIIKVNKNDYNIIHEITTRYQIHINEK